MTEEQLCEHEKVYANYAFMSYPPQHPWICRKCGIEGVDTIKNFKFFDGYDVLKKYFNSK